MDNFSLLVEEIDFALDPMWVDIKPELFEHIDGPHTFAPHQKTTKIKTKAPIAGSQCDKLQ